MTLSDRNNRAFREHDRMLMRGDWDQPECPKFEEFESVIVPNGGVGTVLEVTGNDRIGFSYHVFIEHSTEATLDEYRWFTECQLTKVGK